MDRLSHTEIKFGSEVLVCSACLACGRTSWSHDGSPESTEDMLATLERFWRMPWMRRPRKATKQDTTTPGSDVTLFQTTPA
jgi:ribosome-binding protein aMBF1 (putative translation factor)